jgi:hypothetical protein
VRLSIVYVTSKPGLEKYRALDLPFHVIISMSCGRSASISTHLSVISDSHMKTQFLESKCVRTTVIRLLKAS